MDISVIVPFYNGNKYVKNLLKMLDENVANLKDDISVELIIVNDSPWVEVEKVTDEHKYFVRILNFENNVGIQGARVRGLKAATGTFIHMLDQDDTIENHFLERMYYAIGNDDVVVANGWRQSPVGDKPIFINHKKQCKVDKLFYYVYLENRILSPGHCLIRKSAIPEEWYNLQLKQNGADDLVLWVLMLCKRASFIILSEKLYNHIDTGENVSGDDLKMAASTLEACSVLKEIQYVPRWVSLVLERKTRNDIFYVEYGKDRYLDYRLIEYVRKLKGGYRS